MYIMQISLDYFAEKKESIAIFLLNFCLRVVTSLAFKSRHQ
ncbi:hypothetical protein SSYM_0262, partial [Serratia symbiotica str. Tucson]